MADLRFILRPMPTSIPACTPLPETAALPDCLFHPLYAGKAKISHGFIKIFFRRRIYGKQGAPASLRERPAFPPSPLLFQQQAFLKAWSMCHQALVDPSFCAFPDDHGRVIKQAAK